MVGEHGRSDAKRGLIERTHLGRGAGACVGRAELQRNVLREDDVVRAFGVGRRPTGAASAEHECDAKDERNGRSRCNQRANHGA